MTSGKSVRLSRITEGGKMLCIPMDHSITSGPVRGLEEPGKMVEMVARGGATSFLAHKGVIMSLREPPRIGMIMHLSANTSFGPSPNRKVLIGSCDEAVRLGADAVSVHINIGNEDEPEMLMQLGSVAERCESLQVPLVAMMYPRGPSIKDPSDPDTVAHVARIGAEAGADIVKTVYTGSTETFREVIRKCPVPVVLAGGSVVESDLRLLELAESAMSAGAAGVTFGRNVFQHQNPASIVRALRRVVMEGVPPAEALEAMKVAPS